MSFPPSIYFLSVLLTSDLSPLSSAPSPHPLIPHWYFFVPVVVKILHSVVRVSIFRQLRNIFLAVASMIEIGRSQASVSSCPNI